MGEFFSFFTHCLVVWKIGEGKKKKKKKKEERNKMLKLVICVDKAKSRRIMLT